MENQTCIEKAKNVYDFLCNRENVDDTLSDRIIGLSFLEKEFDLDFQNTTDFHQKMQKVLVRYEDAMSLRGLRKRIGWSKKRLAKHLKTTEQFIDSMEEGKRPIIKKASDFVKDG
jgi:DNA-binding XRE family transcriptional regulator